MHLEIDFPSVIKKFDSILKRGLCQGVGTPEGQMCIEAAICASLNLPFGDDPQCVSRAVRAYKITLNDAQWSSPKARAAGLRDLGIAQIGSRGIVDDQEFTKRLAELTIRELIPALFRLPKFAKFPKMLLAADRCEKEGTRAAADAASYAASADASAYAAASYAASADASGASSTTNTFLLLSASLALRVLRELKSPGCEWL